MSDFYILITDAGAALEAEAHANGTTVNLSTFSVCDGGVDFIPDPTATDFPNEVFPPEPISSLSVSSTDSTVLVAQCIIPATSGGYTVRGIAIYTDDGTLYATGNYPNQYKPAPDSGYAASLEINAELAVSDTADITLVVQDGAFLTEAQADTLYLRQDKHLQEIADQGVTAQQEARDNLDLGSAATHDAEDFLPIDYQPPVTSVNEQTGTVQLDAVDVGAVATVNNVSPDEYGNVNIDIPPPADLSNYWTKTESDARYGAGRTVNGTNNAYYTHGNGIVFMQAVNNINVANNTTVTVTLPTSFATGIKGISASFNGTGGEDQDSFYFCRAAGTNQVQIETHNCSGLFSLNVTGW